MENFYRRKALNYYKLQCERNNAEVLKKSQELSSKLIDLDNLKEKLSRTPSTVRSLTPTPSTVRDNLQIQNKMGLNYNYDSLYS